MILNLIDLLAASFVLCVIKIYNEFYVVVNSSTSLSIIDLFGEKPVSCNISKLYFIYVCVIHFKQSLSFAYNSNSSMTLY